MLSRLQESVRAIGASTEEVDLLRRSTKKTKRDSIEEEDGVMEDAPGMNPGFGIDINRAPEEQGRGGLQTPEGQAMSFRAILTGRSEKGSKGEDNEVSDDDEAEQEDGESDCPVIKLTKEEKLRMRKPWRNTLIIKVLGRSVGYNYLLRRLRTMWKPKAQMDLVAIQNGYHIVRFSSVDDYEHAKLEGPWTVLDHCLAVKDWEPDFDPMKDTTQKLLVWVRFPCLPIEYYDYDFLMRVGKEIGEPKKVDQATSLASRGLFARVCVEVDITKPLLAKFKLRNRIRTIEYEGLQLICFKCGVVGHRKEECKNGDSKIPCDELDDDRIPAASGEQNSSSENISKRKEAIEQAQWKESQYHAENNYGPWMIANRKPRSYQARRGVNKANGTISNGQEGNKGEKGKGQQKGNIRRMNEGDFRIWNNSRFGVLEDQEEADYPEAFLENQSEERADGPARPNIPGKGKRPQIQISEAQLANDNHVQNSRNKGDNGVHKGKGGETRVRGERASTLKKAAESEDHMVVRGFEKGTRVVRMVVSDEGEVIEEDCQHATLGEHHQDPPVTDMDVESREGLENVSLDMQVDDGFEPASIGV